MRTMVKSIIKTAHWLSQNPIWGLGGLLQLSFI